MLHVGSTKALVLAKITAGLMILDLSGSAHMGEKSICFLAHVAWPQSCDQRRCFWPQDEPMNQRPRNPSTPVSSCQPTKGLATSNKDTTSNKGHRLLGAKDATRGSWHRYERSKELLGIRSPCQA